MQNKATVVYHSGDLDGEFCREIFKHWNAQYRAPGPNYETVNYIGWDYKDAKIPFPETGQVYVMDLNPECFKEFPGIDVAKARVIWIDHHATAIDKWGTYLPGLRIDGVAACRLAWFWFFNTKHAAATKEVFLQRKAEEPLAVRLAGEYDVWDHRGDGDLEFQLGLKAQEEIPWNALLDPGADQTHLVGRIIQNGRMIQGYVTKQAALKAKGAFRMPWRGLTWLVMNTIGGNSMAFDSVDKPENGHDALMIFYWSGRSWEFSLYHAKHRKDLNLSDIAKAYGGGGHPGACGFRVRQIPFPLMPQD